MKKMALLIFPLAFMAIKAPGQNPTVKSLIDNGVNLYDHGKYYDAIAEYQQALAMDNNSEGANLEMANSYIALQKYDKAIEYSNKVIQLNDKYVDQAYTVKGTALDLMKNLPDAIAAYQEGIKRFPDNYLLLYNASLSCFKAGKYNESAGYAAGAVRANPHHASSQLLLGSAMCYLGKRPQSLLALYNFLLLEPDSKRSGSALDLLIRQTKKGINKENDTIKINVVPGDPSDEFGKMDMMLSLMEASKNTDKNKQKPEEQFFAEFTELFLTVLDETKEEDRKKSIWWTNYMPLFHDLLASKNTEAFCYYISQSKNSDLVKKWIGGHKDKMEAFNKWRDKYTGKK